MLDTVEGVAATMLMKVQRMDLADVTELIFVGLSVVGQHFISNRDRRGFYFWIMANLMAIVLFVGLQRYPTVVLYTYFLYASSMGLVRWRRAEITDALAAGKVTPASHPIVVKATSA
jgi:nicotinamide riboside transporter PnuC